MLGLGVLAFSFFAALGGVSSASRPKVSTDPQTIAAGEQLYNLHCSSCHGVAGSGSTRAPSLVYEGAAGADFYLSTGRMPLNNPHDQPINHHPFFTEGQIQQLDSYINALPQINGRKGSGPGIPTVLPLCQGSQASNSTGIAAAERNGTAKCVTLSFGQTTFALNCSQCHQIGGNGGILSKGNIVPTLQNADITQTAEAMRIGPIPMPKFGSGQLSAVQLAAVAHYVQYLQHPNHAGGFKITGFGPVAEGFVGIIAGLGLLLIVSRLMGTRG